MTAKIIDGKALASEVRAKLKDRVTTLVEKGHRPGLAVILVGDDPASQVYVRNKLRSSEEVGIQSFAYRLAKETTQEELLALIDKLNQDSAVDGILVQLPVPKQIDPAAIIRAIAPEKDVDGFHVINAGLLMTRGKASAKAFNFVPCTPAGVIKMIDSTGYEISGKNALVIGRSNIVGKPVALLLLERNATVTIAHSRTKDLASLSRQADILVVAIGKPKAVTADMVKPGALVIDVGINRGDDGHLCGDVDTKAVSEVAGWITPVPGGVGPMTIAMLLENTVLGVENRLGLSH